MKLFGRTTWVCCVLAFLVLSPATFADPKDDEEQAAKNKADEANNQQAKHKAKAAENQQPARDPIVLRERPPLYDLQKLIPKQSPLPTGRVAVEPKPPAAAPKAGAQARAPGQTRLSPAAAYRLGSMGQHVFLSPAMRFHLNRNGGAAFDSPNSANSNAALSAASQVPGEGARKFYPGVSRLPTQKPFANIEPQPTAMQRYWPLLLEGREDPNTGLIIWSLP